MEKIPQEGGTEAVGAGQERSLPTTENLQQEMVALRAKVEAARAQKEADVEKKISERESLIGEAKSNVELLAQTNQTLDYFTTMQELGNLDEADIQKLEELKTLLASLEQKQDEIDQKIEIISKTPEVLNKIQDAATKENVQQELEKLEKNFESEFYPKIDELKIALNTAVKTTGANGTDYPYKDARENLSIQNEKIRKVVDGMVNKILSNRGRNDELITFSSKIDVAWRRADTIAGFVNEITEMRSDLGFFDGKKKAYLDSLLEGVKPLAPSVTKAEKEHKEADDELVKREAELDRIQSELRNVLTETEPMNEQYKNLTGNSVNYNKFASKLVDRFGGGRMGRRFEWSEFDDIVRKKPAEEKTS